MKHYEVLFKTPHGSGSMIVSGAIEAHAATRAYLMAHSLDDCIPRLSTVKRLVADVGSTYV